jgi:hypothetical protein
MSVMAMVEGQGGGAIELSETARVVLEVGVIALCGGLWFGAVNSVRKMVGSAVGNQKAQVKLATRLQEAELRILDGTEYETEAEAAKDKEDVRRMKALLIQMETEAENGERIRMDSRTAKPITLLTYFTKSFNSLLVNRDENLKDGEAPIFQKAVTLTLLACFAWQLSGLLGLAFDPTRT